MSEYITDERGEVHGEIVRCRDCKHYGCDGYDEHYCYYWDKLREPDGFCAWGERNTVEVWKPSSPDDVTCYEGKE